MLTIARSQAASTGDLTISHFADRLLDAIDAKGSPICVGIDPVLERLPESLRADADANPRSAEAAAAAIERFCFGVLDVVAPLVPCVKPQAACFERYLWPGVRVYHRVIARARELGLCVIADAKRGDIGSSSAHYAAGLLADPPFDDLGTLAGPDALTVNSYLGDDGLEPFLAVADAQGKGLFVLVRTSNPGGDAVQTPMLSTGGSVAEHVASIMARLGRTEGLVGNRGYSLLGAVVGATKPEDAALLRKAMPQQLFLVPGFGAQGASAEDVRPCFNADGSGAIIPASRSVLYAYEKQPGRDWRQAVADEAGVMKQQVAAVLS